MVDLAEAPPVVAAGSQAVGEATLSRLGIAVICMAGVALGSTILPFFAVDAARGPMMLELGWSASQLRLSYNLMLWAGALSVWPIGILTDRFGPRRTVAAAAVAIALVSLLLPFVSHVWQFCVLFTLLGVCGSFGLGYSKIVASLFDRHRGLAFGIFAAGGSALSMTLPQATQRLVHDSGWRGAFSILGLVVLALAPILYFGLTRPAARPWSGEKDDPEAKGVLASEAVRARAFWLILLAGLVSALVSSIVMTALATALPHRGLGEALDLRVTPIGRLAYLAAPVFAGVLLDRTRSPIAAVAAMIASALTCLIWAMVSPGFGGKPLLMTSYVMGAIALSAQGPVVGYLLTRHFGLKAFLTVYSLQTCIQAVVLGVCSPVIALFVGPLADERLVFVLGALAAFAAAGLYLLLPAYRFGAPCESGLAAGDSGGGGRPFRSWWSRAPS